MSPNHIYSHDNNNSRYASALYRKKITWRKFARKFEISLQLSREIVMLETSSVYVKILQETLIKNILQWFSNFLRPRHILLPFQISRYTCIRVQIFFGLHWVFHVFLYLMHYSVLHKSLEFLCNFLWIKWKLSFIIFH